MNFFLRDFPKNVNRQVFLAFTPLVGYHGSEKIVSMIVYVTKQ